MLEPNARIRYVYVAGPLRSSGDFETNIRAAVDMGEKLLRHGFIPFVPHTHHNGIWTTLHWRSYNESMAFDFAWVARCDALIRLPGVSNGSDQEVNHAKALGIPVFHSLADLAKEAIRRNDLQR